jgi:hypothetical protein
MMVLRESAKKIIKKYFETCAFDYSNDYMCAKKATNYDRMECCFFRDFETITIFRLHLMCVELLSHGSNVYTDALKGFIELLKTQSDGVDNIEYESLNAKYLIAQKRIKELERKLEVIKKSLEY